MKRVFNTFDFYQEVGAGGAGGAIPAGGTTSDGAGGVKLAGGVAAAGGVKLAGGGGLGMAVSFVFFSAAFSAGAHPKRRAIKAEINTTKITFFMLPQKRKIKLFFNLC